MKVEVSRGKNNMKREYSIKVFFTRVKNKVENCLRILSKIALIENSIDSFGSYKVNELNFNRYERGKEEIRFQMQKDRILY